MPIRAALGFPRKESSGRAGGSKTLLSAGQHDTHPVDGTAGAPTPSAAAAISRKSAGGRGEAIQELGGLVLRPRRLHTGCTPPHVAPGLAGSAVSLLRAGAVAPPLPHAPAHVLSAYAAPWWGGSSLSLSAERDRPQYDDAVTPTRAEAAAENTSISVLTARGGVHARAAVSSAVASASSAVVTSG